MTKPVCAISDIELSFPVCAFTHVQPGDDIEETDHDYVIIKDGCVDMKIRDEPYEVPCQGRFHIDAIAEHIAKSLICRVKVLCPSCEQPLDGICLDATHTPHDEEVAYQKESENPEIIALADEIAMRFIENEGNRLTMVQMIAMRDHLELPIVLPSNEEEMVQPNAVPHDEEERVPPIAVPHDGVEMDQPIVFPHNEEGNEDQCDLDGCVSKVGPIALFVGILFTGCSIVRSIFTPSGRNDEPKKNPNHTRGVLMNTGHLYL